MPLYVKLSSTLRPYVAGYNPEEGITIEIRPGATAADIANLLGLPPEEIKFIMLNGRCMDLETPLQPNDRLAFFPAVGGG